MIFSFFRRQARNGQRKSIGHSLPAPTPISSFNEEADKGPPAQGFDPIKWARDNPWLVEGQADDRLPVNGAVSAIGGTPAEQRSFARSTHQAMFKIWSQARHD